MAAVEEPLTAGDLDRWTSGLPSADAGAALLMLGLDAGRLDAWVRAAGSAVPAEGVFLDWGARQADRDAQGLADLAGQVRLPQTFDAEQPASTAPPLRVAVQDGGAPLVVGPRLLAFPGVASVVVPVERASGTVRRRAWRWPLSIGVTEDADGLEGAIAAAGRLPPGLVDVRDLRVDPGHVDVLLVRGAVAEAMARLAELRPLANAVVLLAAEHRAWPDLVEDLARLRTRTGAVAVALTTGAPRRGSRRGPGCWSGRWPTGTPSTSRSPPRSTVGPWSWERPPAWPGRPCR